jgi:hypothetical protein
LAEDEDNGNGEQAPECDHPRDLDVVLLLKGPYYVTPAEPWFFVPAQEERKKPDERSQPDPPRPPYRAHHVM